MNSLIISYDAIAEVDYDVVHRVIKSYGNWFHLAESTWAVTTQYSADAIYSDLNKFLTDRSCFVVVEVEFVSDFFGQNFISSAWQQAEPR